MGKAKDRITPKKVKAAKAATKPSVKVDGPKVEVNPQIIVSTAELAATIDPLIASVNAAIEASTLAQQASLNLMNEAMARIEGVVAELRKMKETPIKLSTPGRPNDFSVEFDDENGDPATLRIHANVQH